MSDSISLEGKEYISSKRASELSGYSQDYIGQLSRLGVIDARRIGGLWYISVNALQAHKTKAESYQPQPPVRSGQTQEPETVVSFDGKEYLSAARASEVTGYHQDYVGQLARSGKILSRQIGTRWYVERQAILSHKQEKDSLLGAVQTQAVGLQHLVPSQHQDTLDLSEPYFTYRKDDGDLIPALGPQEEEISPVTPVQIQVQRPNKVPIRVLATPRYAMDGVKRPAPRVMPAIVEGSETNSGLVRGLFVPALLTIVVVIFVGYVSLQASSIYASLKGNSSSQVLTAGAANAAKVLNNEIETFLARKIEYQRAQ